MSIAAGFGGVLGLLSIKPIMDSYIPGVPAEKITNVKIVAGAVDSDGGNEPCIHLFDNQGQTIGVHDPKDGKTIPLGISRDISVVHTGDRSSAQAEYISVVQDGNDALCISAITLTTQNNIQYVFYGDIGVACGAHWWYGNVTVSNDKGQYQPNCIWVDGDGSAGITTKGYGIHMPSFQTSDERNTEYNKHNDVMCNADPRFHIYDNLGYKDSIPYFKSKPYDPDTLVDYDTGKMVLDQNNWGKQPRDPMFDQSPMIGIPAISYRSNQNKNRFAGRLVISPYPGHTATAICQSATSRGPDFVSTEEKLFCDMETRTIHPLCDGATKTNCFDLGGHVLRVDKRNVPRTADGRILPSKSYTDVQHW